MIPKKKAAENTATLDVKVTDILAESYLVATSSSAGEAAEDAVDRKELVSVTGCNPYFHPAGLRNDQPG